MTTSKLYKNGNSTVCVIPTSIVDALNLRPGDHVEFYSVRQQNYAIVPITIIAKSKTYEKPKATAKP